MHCHVIKYHTPECYLKKALCYTPPKRYAFSWSGCEDTEMVLIKLMFKATLMLLLVVKNFCFFCRVTV